MTLSDDESRKLAEEMIAEYSTGRVNKLAHKLIELLDRQRWIPVVEQLPEPESVNLEVWCGWAMFGCYKVKNPRRSAGCDWHSEPAGIAPIFHVSHWRYKQPPEQPP